MSWIDIASIVFVCVTANHLGLIGAVETVIRHRLPVFSCPKCLTFWLTLGYCLWETQAGELIEVLAISFLCAYLAIWVELFEGYVDIIYLRAYENIYSTQADEVAADADNGNTAGPVSDVRQDG